MSEVYWVQARCWRRYTHDAWTQSNYQSDHDGDDDNDDDDDDDDINVKMIMMQVAGVVSVV